jgi:hypothetical protein
MKFLAWGRFLANAASGRPRDLCGLWFAIYQGIWECDWDPHLSVLAENTVL